MIKNKSSTEDKSFDKIIIGIIINLDDGKSLEKVECSFCGQQTKYVGTDILIVFIPERIFLSALTQKDYINLHIWNSVGRGYLINGKKVDISIQDIMLASRMEGVNREINIKMTMNNRNVDFINFIKANYNRYRHVQYAFSELIKEDYIRLPIVSFSGGKDSTVVSDLVIKVLNDINILHVFGGTTLELLFTYEYIERFNDKPLCPPFLPIDEPLVEEFGLPNRVMRWCCTFIK